MSKITRTRNSTRRISFAWTTTDAAGNTAPLDLTGCTLQMLIDTEKVESTPQTPVRVAALAAVISDAPGGKAHFLNDINLSGTIRDLYFEVWIVDAIGETYTIDSGTLIFKGGLK